MVSFRPDAQSSTSSEFRLLSLLSVRRIHFVKLYDAFLAKLQTKT
jgi:hypothetical protein